MSNSEEKDLMSIGKHCSDENCKQIDFLPFKCVNCSKEFCLLHRQPSKHSCTFTQVQDSVIPRCPLCMKLIVKGVNGVDDNQQVELHISSGCLSNLLIKRKKNKCSYAKCKTASPLPFHCNKCFSGFCVRHRHPNDHHCNASLSQRSVAAH